MTFAEHIQANVRKVRIVKWGAVAVMVGAVFLLVVVHQDSNAVLYALSAVVMAPTAVLLWRVVRQTRCPKCRIPLDNQVLFGKASIPHFCSKCGADFSEQMPYDPTKLID